MFAVIGTWKDFLWPLLVLPDPNMQPLSVRLPTLQPTTELDRLLLVGDDAASSDAIATHLPAETQMFVPRVEATLARREGVKLSELQVPSG